VTADDAPGPDPLEVFARWRAEIEGTPDADAIALATATRDGRPSVRYVLMKGVTDRGVRFFTNYRSRKGAELDANPACALVWLDAVNRRQVRVEGRVERLSAAESDAYFATRERGSQLGAVASPQSAELRDRAELERALDDATARFDGRDVERPAHWGGYLLAAECVELWLGRPDRLHDRFCYRRGDDGWSVVRLAP
jgi:pyridoxamine 5'-phosphate oxidase